MYSTIDDVLDVAKIQLGASADLISSDGWEQVGESVANELGWAFPVSNPTQCLWYVRRAVRQAIYLLWIAAAHKFKYKQINLQHRFEHYGEILKRMDEEFTTAQESDPSLFAGVESYKLFGTQIAAGFAYDSLGRDITYDVSNYVLATPNEDS